MENTATHTTTVRESDGFRFPVYEGKLLSWSLGLYHTHNESRTGYPRMRRVIQAMIEFRPEQVERERREMLKASFDRMFGHNAQRCLDVIEQELAAAQGVK